MIPQPRMHLVELVMLMVVLVLVLVLGMAHVDELVANGSYEVPIGWRQL